MAYSGFNIDTSFAGGQYSQGNVGHRGDTEQEHNNRQTPTNPNQQPSLSLETTSTSDTSQSSLSVNTTSTTSQPSLSLNTTSTSDNSHDDEGLHGMMGIDPVQVEDSGPKANLNDQQMLLYATMDLVELRAAALAQAKRQRMTEDMKDELEELYYNFQCDVTRLALRNRVASHLYFGHIGQARRVNGSSSWNHFQQYDPEAQALFKEFGRQEGGAQVSALWRSKSWEEKRRYRDYAYVRTLQQVTPDSNSSVILHAPIGTHHARLHGLNGRVQTSKVSLQKTASMVAEWESKMHDDLQSFSFYHHIEGFFVLASRHPKSPIFRQGGSPLGEGFLRMLARDVKTDVATEFHTWTAAQAIEINKGIVPNLHLPSKKKDTTKVIDEQAELFRVGNHKINIKALRTKLRELIYTASGHKINAAWPGEDTDYGLRQMKISLEIEPNDWNIIPDDLKQPLVHLGSGPALAILACLGLNLIHLSYHPEWETVPPRPRKRSAEDDNDEEDDDVGVQEGADQQTGQTSTTRRRAKKSKKSKKSDASSSVSETNQPSGVQLTNSANHHSETEVTHHSETEFNPESETDVNHHSEHSETDVNHHSEHSETDVNHHSETDVNHHSETDVNHHSEHSETDVNYHAGTSDGSCDGLASQSQSGSGRAVPGLTVDPLLEALGHDASFATYF
ncbi:hypothetical protein MJO28_015956 [Puccinia striiformis f. sp. tritici]|uniref:Uncharacterized protein n=1 Tax=Puccinia striiformis f. sp. tritici TaxID=168172 RepID=A0ACC0DQS2_9BASI|nr:hypothetical protein MJO28_015956 [Puccinia striiformis f. sp. tritici]KAI9608137.1 hypothetical protein H4Q26_005593 [Puccinia striiformis f. sp. tritici PST-130]